MVSNRSYLFVLILILLAFVPAILLRDFNAVNELNYLGIAQDALDRGNFFTFYQDGLLYSDKPPIYLWLCMLGLYFFGPHYAMSFLLLVSVCALVFLIVLFDRFFASDFTAQERILLILGCGSLLFVDICAVLGRKDMLFTAVMLFSYIKLIKRYSLIKTHKILGRKKVSHNVSYGNLVIPLCLFLGILIKGPYAFIMPVLALIFVLWYNQDIKRLFTVFRPYYLLIILICFALWALGVYFEGGTIYLKELFINQPLERFIGNIGHPRAFTFFGEYYLLLTLPIGLSALYFMGWHIYLGWQNHLERKKQTAIVDAAIKRAEHERVAMENALDLGLLQEPKHWKEPIQLPKVKPIPLVLNLKQQATLFFFLSVLLVITIPASKLEIYLLPGILPLFYYVALSYRQFHARHRGIDLCFEQDYLVVPISAFTRAHAQQQKEEALALIDFGPSSSSITGTGSISDVALVNGLAVNAANLVNAHDNEASSDLKAINSRESNARSVSLLRQRADLASITKAKVKAIEANHVVNIGVNSIDAEATSNFNVTTKPEFHLIGEDDESDNGQNNNSKNDNGQNGHDQKDYSKNDHVDADSLNPISISKSMPNTLALDSAKTKVYDNAQKENESASAQSVGQAVIEQNPAWHQGDQIEHKHHSALNSEQQINANADLDTNARVCSISTAATTNANIALPRYQHWGLEIEDDGYMLAGLKTRSERVPVPWFLTLSLLLPLLSYVSLLAVEVRFYERVAQLQTPMVGLAFGVLAFFSLGAIFFLLNRLYLFSLAVSGMATLGFVFCIGMAMPHLNDYFGVGSMVSQISAAVDQGAKPDVCTFSYRNVYAMAVYDRRLHFHENSKGLNDCVQNNSNIMFSPRAINSYPQQAKYLRSLGAITVGNSLLLLSHAPKNTLSTLIPNSLDVDADFIGSNSSINLNPRDNFNSSSDLEPIYDFETELMPKAVEEFVGIGD